MTREQLRAMLPEGTEDAAVTKILDALHAEIKPHKDANDKAAALEFGSKLDGKLKDKGARNLKAARALLDLEALRASKNQDADIDAAIKALIDGEDTAFIFEAQPTGAKKNIGASVGKAPGAADGVEATFAALNPGMKLD